MTKHRAKAPIPAVLDVPQAIPVLDQRVPTGDLAAPGPDVVIHADVAAKHIATPAIVIAGDPKHRDSRLDEIRERRKHAERRARNHVPPLEPELEQIAVDDERPGALREMPEEREELSLDLGGADSEVSIGKDVARGREHGDSLLRPTDLYKRAGSTHFRARCSGVGANAPTAHP
jgi:hypothetical protein